MGQCLSFPVSFPAHQVPSEKESALKGKNLFPLLAFFPLRVDSFLQTSFNNFDKLASPERISVSLECTDAQPDLDFCCPHMLKNYFHLKILIFGLLYAP